MRLIGNCAGDKKQEGGIRSNEGSRRAEDRGE